MRKSGVRWIVAAAGLTLLVYLVSRIGFHQLAESITRLGWGLALVVVCGALPLLLRTCAWRLTLPEGQGRVLFSRLFGLRLGSEAIAQLGVIGTALGDGVRVSLLGGEIRAASGIASVTLDRMLFTLSATVVTAAGAMAALLTLRLPHPVAMGAEIVVGAIAILITAAAIAAQRGFRILSALARLACRVPIFRQRVRKRLHTIHSVDEEMLSFLNGRGRAFRAAFLLNLTAQLAAIGEVWLVLHLLGVSIGITGSLAIEALTKIINAVGGLNPGNIGTYEGGNMLIGKLFGFGATTGMAVAFARRVRAISWSVVGAICMVFLEKKAGSQPAHERDRAATPTTAAIIFAGSVPPSQLTKVGEVPVLLRGILGLCKAGFGRIVVAVDPAQKESIAFQLAKTGRLPNFIEWFETDADGRAFRELIDRLERSGVTRLAVLSGRRTYHSSLLQILAAWTSLSRGLVLRDHSSEIGGCTLPISAARAFAASVTRGGDLECELTSWALTARTVSAIKPPESLWQSIRGERERLTAEHKLDKWLVKSTDGIFARFNRRISIPISRQLIRFPITPNMVSIFTLGVSLLSGVLFACGGYLYMLEGALLGLFASILDGCDGEVARLKLQESAFGCWLETVCDYLYYVFMFAGMTIGLVRSSGDRLYLYLGCALAFGALMSFLTTAMQRRRLAAADRPEQLLKNWQKEAERRSKNPFLYLARHTEFIVRRCFLPYAILVFAVLRIVPAAFMMSVVGANVVWPIALYSYCTFPAASREVARA